MENITLALLLFFLSPQTKKLIKSLVSDGESRQLHFYIHAINLLLLSWPSILQI